jgi:hypothetical protein
MTLRAPGAMLARAKMFFATEAAPLKTVTYRA